MNTLGDYVQERHLAMEWPKRALAEKYSISHSEIYRKIIDGLTLNTNLNDEDYNNLAMQVEVLLDIAKKKRNPD